MIAGAALFGCAGDRRNIDLSSRAVEGLTPSQNLAIVVRGDDEMGPAYRLRRVTYRLDGKPIHESSARIYRGYAEPGQHVLEVEIEYEPNDSGIFEDETTYHVEVARELKFMVMPDVVTTVSAVVGEDGELAYLVDYPEAVATR
jgi:hypothetical protein